MLKGIHRGERSCWIESARRHGAWLIGPPNTPQLGVFLMPYAGTMTPASPVLTAPPATVPLAAPPAAPPAHHPPALPPSAGRHMPISATLAANEARGAPRKHRLGPGGGVGGAARARRWLVAPARRPAQRGLGRLRSGQQAAAL